MTKTCQFRLSDEDVATIDWLATAMTSEPTIAVTRTEVVRAAIRALAEKYRRTEPAPSRERRARQ